MIHIIVNPAAGQDIAVLATLNAVFQPAEIPWRVSVTQKSGDATTQAKAAVTDGVDVVAVYGGDGTIAEAAGGLIGSDIPLAILPGGTANVVAQELGIPLNLTDACKLIADNGCHVRKIDVGQVNDCYFLLRVGMGAEAKIAEGADRGAKDRFGFLAYLWSAAQSLTTIESATYHITVDDREMTIDGVSCAIINSGNLGVGNLQIAPTVRIDDGLLDIFVVKSANLPALIELINSVSGTPEENVPSSSTEKLNSHLYHLQGQAVQVRSTPVQTIQYDGELLEAEETNCRVIPQALAVLVPTE